MLKGKKKGIIHTRDIYFFDIISVFFPKNFYEKYRYLGAIPYNSDGEISKAIEPLIIFMDHKAKPKFCPRWFLRFLHLFGNDNSIIRVRNFKLHNLHSKLTKGIMMLDYKTKWNNYDLRISVVGDKQINDLSDDIEFMFYHKGLREELILKIKEIKPDFKVNGMSNTDLSNFYDDL
jgi:hypothetical protein